MHKSEIKKFAVWARNTLHAQITQRAALFGLHPDHQVAPESLSGQQLVLAGQVFGADEAKGYAQLNKRLKTLITQQGHYQRAFSHLVEEAAWNWFNRLCALRLMEVNGYLPRRALSSSENSHDPDLLRDAVSLAVNQELPGISVAEVDALRHQDDAALYRKLLIAQCNALKGPYPFLFETISDELALLLPLNLLNPDSVLRRLVSEIPEADWQEVEIIGWLYQYYISERKDAVIGAKTQVASADIPAATQLFTPAWIVQYMVQNSLGRLWLEHHPESGLRGKMDYYLESGGSRGQGTGDREQGVGNGEQLRGEEVQNQKNGNSDLQGSIGLAEGNGFGGGSVSPEQTLSQGGALRFDESNATSGGVDPLEYRGGSCSSEHSRIQKLSLDSAGISGGIRNTAPDRISAQLSLGIGTQDSVSFASGDQQNADITASKTKQGLNPSPDPWSLTPAPPLQPQDLTLIDPACGSGHILVYAFELLTEIYREQGYRERDIPALILEHNLVGLDLDGRAAQLAAFALMIKARAKVKEVKGLQPRILQVQTSRGIDLSDARTFGVAADALAPWQALVDCFKDADTLGSLITPPDLDYPALQSQLASWQQSDHSYFQALAQELTPLLRQAQALHTRYAVVVANPPYMGNKSLNNTLKTFFQAKYPDYKSDLFAVAMVHYKKLCKPGGHLGFMTPFVWMFIQSYEKLRKHLLEQSTITSLIQPEYHAIFELAFVPICTFTLRNQFTNEKGEFIKLTDFTGAENQPIKTLEAVQNPACGYRYQASSSDFEKIPGSPIAYWVSEKVREIFEQGTPLGEIAEPKQGLATANNDRFLRIWHEVLLTNIGFGMKSRQEAQDSGLKWFPCNKGGAFRRWYGNNEFIVNWQHDGLELTNFSNSVIRNPNYYFKEGLTWSTVSSSDVSFRFSKQGNMFETKGSICFVNKIENTYPLLGLLNTKIVQSILQIMSPTLDYHEGPVSKIPLILSLNQENISNIISLEQLSKTDWDSFETSWDFEVHPLVRLGDWIQGTGISKEDSGSPSGSPPGPLPLTPGPSLSPSGPWPLPPGPSGSPPGPWPLTPGPSGPSDPCPLTPDPCSLSSAYQQWQAQSLSRFRELQRLEEENNRYWINAYGLQDELSPEVPDEQITVRQADQERDLKSLLSYALGCIMGRYSLDQPGLIHAGQPFDPSKHQRFPADGDGIVPVHDTAWFEDDLVLQIMAWLKTVFGETHYAANLRYLAEVLEQKRGESPEDTLRRYFLNQFMKDHHQIYKKRPIYWFFTSGKKRAFNAYVYLHRYDADTLARLRTDYLHPLQLKLEHELKRLRAENTQPKRIKTLQDQLEEIQAYDEVLKHKADQRINIDLDDGVAYNYTLFEGLVYEGADLKMADLKAKSQWKRDLLAQQEK